MSATVLKSTKIIPVLKTLSFHRTGAAIAADPTLTLLVAIAPIPPLARSKVVELDITFGVADDPTDEIVEFFLIAADPNNLPPVSAARNNAIWQSAQLWRDIGAAPAVILQTLNRELVDFLFSEVFETTSIDARRRSLSFVLCATSNVGSTGHIQGNAVVQSELLQRTFNGRGTKIRYNR